MSKELECCVLPFPYLCAVIFIPRKSHSCQKKKKDIVCFLSLVFQNLCYILDPECPKNICVKVLIICIVLPKCGAQMGLSVIMCMSLQGIVGLWFLHSLFSSHITAYPYHKFLHTFSVKHCYITTRSEATRLLSKPKCGYLQYLL